MQSVGINFLVGNHETSLLAGGGSWREYACLLKANLGATARTRELYWRCSAC
jgi:hypothetical protein